MAETMPVVESRRIRVLVAEDHRIAREAIQRCLEQQADMAVVGAAANGSETVHLAQRQRPDVAVLDLRLSELRDGEVQEPLRRALARTRIVLVTNAEHVRALRA